MPKSPFSNKVFRSALITFKVADGDSVIDERGNRKTPGRELLVKFYVKPSGGSSAREESGLNTGSTSISAYVLEVNEVAAKDFPLEIKPGDVGVGSIDGRAIAAKVENVSQSSVVAVTQALGQRVQLSISYTAKEGATG